MTLHFGSIPPPCLNPTRTQVQVLRYAVSPSDNSEWAVGKSVCILHHGQEMLRPRPRTRCMQVEVFCYALSPSDNSEWRNRIAAETEHFLDVSAWGVPDIARKIAADGIQVGGPPAGQKWLSAIPDCPVVHATPLALRAQAAATQTDCLAEWGSRPDLYLTLSAHPRTSACMGLHCCHAAGCCAPLASGQHAHTQDAEHTSLFPQQPVDACASLVADGWTLNPRPQTLKSKPQSPRT